MDNLQEKFQITAPSQKNDDASDDGDKWVTPNSQFVHFGFKDGLPVNIDGQHTPLNRLPTNGIYAPGLHEMNLVIAGSSDVTDVANIEAIRDGFAPHNMQGTDDQFTGEHVDLFYGEAVGENDIGKKVVGFVERNNYLDRA
jgi:hypothetical protein